MKRTTILATAISAMAAASSFGAFSIAPLGTFGGGDGWRAPSEVVTGDAAGTATAGSYNYLGVGSLERGLAYNAATGNLVLVSRSTSGNGIRVLDGGSGVDLRGLNQGTAIAGGTFTTNDVGVAGDGKVYVNNLTTNTTSSAYKVYQWADDSATSVATTFFGSTIAATGTPRLGDSFDVTGTGASTRLVQGFSGSIGYVVIDNVAAANAVQTFTPATPVAGEFRLGITFAGSSTKVWGKQTGIGGERRTTVTGTGTASYDGASTFTSAGETAQDYLSIGGHAFLAVLDINNSFARVYNMDDPANPAVLGGLTNTTGTLTANGNATGAVAWGASSVLDYNNASATLYAMSTNQGVQAFTINLPIPEPTTLATLAGSAVLSLRRRRI